VSQGQQGEPVIEMYGRQVPTELAEIAAPKATALVVIDMQNDLCSNDGAFAAQGADMSGYTRIAPRIARLVAEARASGVLVIFVKATTRPDHVTQSLPQLFFELRMQQSYPDPKIGPFVFCVAGTWGHEVLPELGYRNTDVLIEKYRSSAFIGTSLDLVLRSAGVMTVVAVGCTTEGCVDSTVREAGFLDYFPVVPQDCVASDNPELHEAAMIILNAYRAVVVDSDDLVAIWRAASATPDGAVS
jgi:nicotinamidase-related amidase